ncbi:hypothetical protein Ahy_A03g012289 isoform B [Arachis hypogaea]|uniref:Uncharacterized protein n=1 Tax=Arachis hypogaea TaxID=3818 RepID=A0A445DT50_ARAHY|nr:hypothetical protein Ahy_A03g012289 isoform B [Arachis hypogaea]
MNENRNKVKKAFQVTCSKCGEKGTIIRLVKELQGTLDGNLRKRNQELRLSLPTEASSCPNTSKVSD